jgi:hypothetical protein
VSISILPLAFGFLALEATPDLCIRAGLAATILVSAVISLKIWAGPPRLTWELGGPQAEAVWEVSISRTDIDRQRGQNHYGLDLSNLEVGHMHSPPATSYYS